MSEPRPVVRSALLIGLCTLASRVTGLARDVLLFQTFGLGWVADAWNFAFQIPNLFRRLFGEGALAAAFVPTFTRALERDGQPRAWQVLGGTFSLLTVVLTGLIVLIEVGLLIGWQTSTGIDAQAAEARRLLLALTALMLPFMLSICILALFCSVLNCLHSFVPAALTPIILNLFMIAGILWVGPQFGGDAKEHQIYAVAACVLAAGCVQLLFIYPFLRRHGVKLSWRWAPRDPVVMKVITLMGPVILGQGVLALGVFLDAGVCWLFTHRGVAPTTAHWLGIAFDYPLREGALSAITCAARLYQFPLGVLAVSLGTAALPAFSRFAAREDWSAWANEVRSALRLAVFVGLLAGIMMILIPESLVRLLFEYREFGPADTRRAARVLTFYGFGMWAYFVQHLILRAFFSIRDVKTPLKISCLFLPINLAISVLLIWHAQIREAAFAISSALTTTAAVVVGLVLLSRRTRAPLLGPSAWSALARMLAAAAATVVVTHIFYNAWSPWLSANIAAVVLRRAADAFGPLAVGGVTYLATSWVLRLDEPRLLLRRRR